MAKRLMMVMLFVGAIGIASLVAPSTAEARGCHRGYGGGHFYGGGPVYGGPVYGRSYYGGGFYAPQRSFYRGYGPGYYGGSGMYLNGGRGGLYIRF